MYCNQKKFLQHLTTAKKLDKNYRKLIYQSSSNYRHIIENYRITIIIAKNDLSLTPKIWCWESWGNEWWLGGRLCRVWVWQGQDGQWMGSSLGRSLSGTHRQLLGGSLNAIIVMASCDEERHCCPKRRLCIETSIDFFRGFRLFTDILIWLKHIIEIIASSNYGNENYRAS